MLCGECANDTNQVINIGNSGNSTAQKIADAIFIGNQHISGNTMHIMCDVKYFPSKREVVCETTSTSDPTPRYEILSVPTSINTADRLISFIMSQGPWLVHGYTLSDDLRKRIDDIFKYDLKQKP